MPPGDADSDPFGGEAPSVHVLEGRDHEVVRQLHAGGVVRAITPGILVEVLLVVVLGVVERVVRDVCDLGRDRAVALGCEALLERGLRGLGGRPLLDAGSCSYDTFDGS